MHDLVSRPEVPEPCRVRLCFILTEVLASTSLLAVPPVTLWRFSCIAVLMNVHPYIGCYLGSLKGYIVANK